MSSTLTLRIDIKKEGNNIENNYIFVDNYVIGETKKRKNLFYFDKDDYDLVKNYYWILNSRHDVITKCFGKVITMHKLIMGDGIYIHLNNNNSDNRKTNLCSIRGYKNKGKVLLNGYISIYMPEHHRAFDNGCVYEHIIIAEKILGRKLKENECVHHLDKNRMNNSYENLMIFSSNSDHINYHAGGILIPNGDGTYRCQSKCKVVYIYNNRTKDDVVKNKKDPGDITVINKKNNRSARKNLCPVCKINNKSTDAKMCIECRNKERRMNIPDKNELEKLIYNHSFEEIGRKYNVTGKAVQKWCVMYGLPYKRKEINNIKNEVA